SSWVATLWKSNASFGTGIDVMPTSITRLSRAPSSSAGITSRSSTARPARWCAMAQPITWVEKISNVPIRSRSLAPPARRLSDTKDSYSPRSRPARCCKSRPWSVMAIPRPEGTNSTTPSSSSSCLIARDRAGGDSCINSAALRTLPVSATTEKYLIRVMFIVSLSLTVDHKYLLIPNGSVKYNEERAGASGRPGCEPGDDVTTRLIVNADDYAMSPGVSRGILEAHARGVVTSTTALVNTPGATEALAAAPAGAPALGPALHVDLAFGRPGPPPA